MDLLIGISSQRPRQQQQQQQQQQTQNMNLLIGMSSQRPQQQQQQCKVPVIHIGAEISTHSTPQPSHTWTAQKVSAHIHERTPPLDTSLAFLNGADLPIDAVPTWLADLEMHVNQQIHAMSSLIRGKQQ